MARIRASDTKPEQIVRKLVSAMGHRYRLHRRELPGTPDLVFVSKRKVIFVHGCFWHRHQARGCPLARLPKSKQDFWVNKLEGNRLRDLKKQAELRLLGWKHMVVWECELRDLGRVQNRVGAFLES